MQNETTWIIIINFIIAAVTMVISWLLSKKKINSEVSQMRTEIENSQIETAHEMQISYADLVNKYLEASHQLAIRDEELHTLKLEVRRLRKDA